MFRLTLYSPLLSPFGTRECHKIQPCTIRSLPPPQKPACGFPAQASSFSLLPSSVAIVLSVKRVAIALAALMRWYNAKAFPLLEAH
jgi:hypothetical protein